MQIPQPPSSNAINHH